MSKQVSKSEFKAHALEHFRRIQRTGHELVITERGKPVLRVVPYHHDPKQALKELRGTVLEYERPFDPVAIDDWEALR